MIYFFIVPCETLAILLKIVYIYISTTFILEPGQSWKTAALRVPECVCFFLFLVKHSVFKGDVMKEKYMYIALEEAKKAQKKGEIPIGAVVVYKNKIISQQHNMKENLKCSTRHAEILSIEDASRYLDTWRLNDCDLYVTMEPCVMCCGAMLQARINKVYYLVENNKFGGINSLDYINSYEHTNHQLKYELIKNINLETEYVNMLKKFFEEKR